MKILLDFLRFLGSLRVGVAILSVLFILVFWGTLFESRAGMEWGVERFFDSWFLTVAGFFPFPAMKTVALLLFFHLSLAILLRIPHTREKLGILLVHFSFLVLILGCFAGNSFRKSFETFGIENTDVVLDSASGTSFRLLKADSAECLIENGASRKPLRLAWNEPQNVGGFSVYFGETLEISAKMKAVRFWIKRDPFAFVPYLFSCLLAAGIFLCAVMKFRKAKS